MYNFVLISQFGCDLFKNKLIDSVCNARLNNIKILLLFVNQMTENYTNESHPGVDIVYLNINHKCSLSDSRNYAIAYLHKNNVSALYAMIPDDDCWFNPDFFMKIVELPVHNYICRVVDPYKNKDHLKFPKFEKKLGKYNYGVVMSINQIFVYESFIKEGFFDTNLGIGAKYQGSEDSDFFCRMCKYDSFVFLPELEIYHLLHLSKFAKIDFPKLLQLINGYAEGLFYFAYKNKLRYTIFRTAFATPLKVPYYFIKGNRKMSLVYFWNSFYNFSLFFRCLTGKW